MRYLLIQNNYLFKKELHMSHLRTNPLNHPMSLPIAKPEENRNSLLANLGGLEAHHDYIQDDPDRTGQHRSDDSDAPEMDGWLSPAGEDLF
mgnify:CR=1 FL=1